MTKPVASVKALAVAKDGEIPALRTGTSDTYQVKDAADGQTHYRSDFFAAPVNWQDATGAWQPIDTRLVAVSGGGGSMRTTSAATVTTMPSDLASAPVTVTHLGSTIGFQLQNATKATGAVTGSSETWHGALPGTDVTLTSTPFGIKDELTLAGKTSPAAFRYSLTVPAGTRPVLTTGGVVTIVDGKDQVVASLPHPTVTEQGAAAVDYRPVSYQLTGSAASGWTLTTNVEKAWLADPARRFPVTVDPTITYVDNGSTGNISCQLGSGTEATTNECGGTSVAVGGTSNTYRGLFTFALTLPTDAAVDSATLSLKETSAANTTSQPVEIHQMTRAWTSSATWNTYDGTHAWTTAGGDYDAGIQSAATVGGSGNLGLYYWGLQQLVQHWAARDFPNYGILVRATTENGSQTSGFDSQNATTGYQPRLTVVWDPRAGINDANTYVDTTLTDRQQMKVNVGSGDLILTSKEYALSGPSPALAVSRVYNSTRSYTAGSMGYGWTLDTGHDVRAYYGTDGYIHYQAPTNRRYLLKNYAGTGTAGTFTTLTLDAKATVGTGNAVTITYNSSGLVMSFRGSDGMLTSIADRSGNTQTFAYSTTIFSGDGFPYLNSITDAAGRTLTVNHSYLNTGLSDTTGRSTAYTYQNNADPTDVADLTGKHTLYSYDTSHRPTQITTPAGHIVKLAYDSNNRVTSITLVTNIGAGTGPTTTFTYHAFTGSPVTGSTDVTDPNGHVTTYTYDATDRVISTTDALGHTGSDSFNTNDDVTTATDANGAGHTTTYGYDANYDPTAVTAPTGASETGTYPTTATTTNPLYLPSSTTDAQGKTQTLTYEGPGNLAKVQDTTGGTSGVSMVMSYQGDTPPTGGGTLSCGAKPGEVCQTTDGNNHGTTYAYDTAGNLTSVTPPSPMGATSYSYDSLGRLITTTDGNGKHITNTYDNDDRIIKTSYDSGTSTSYTYDDDGNLTAQKELDFIGGTSRETDYTYDTLGRRTSQTIPAGAVSGDGSITYGYDAASNLTSYTDPGGTVGYGYDNADNLTSVTEPGGSCTGYNLTTPTYPPASSHCILIQNDNNGNPTLTYYPGGDKEAETYDASQRAATLAGTAAGGTGPMFNFALTYTSGAGATDGELVSQTIDSGSDANPHTVNYSYDNLDRLTRANVTLTTGGTTVTDTHYCYDNAGNLLNIYTAATTTCASSSGFTYTGAYNNANELTTTAGSSVVGGTVTTDNAGNETSVPSALSLSMSYNDHNQLTNIGGVFGNTNTYAGADNRNLLSSGNTTFLYSDLGVSAFTAGGTSTYATRAPDGELLGLRVGTSASYTSHYLLTDNQNSVIRMLSPTGTVEGNVSYDPTGIVTNNTDTSHINPFLYTGAYYDTTSRLYKLGYRYYDPTLARFTQTDPAGQLTPQQGNLYTYAGDNSTNLTDPNGLLGAACGTRGNPCVKPRGGARIVNYNPRYNPRRTQSIYTNHGFRGCVTWGTAGAIGGAKGGFSGVGIGFIGGCFGGAVSAYWH